MFSEQKNQRECNLNKTQGVAITYSYYLNKNKLKLVKVFFKFWLRARKPKRASIAYFFYIFFRGRGGKGNKWKHRKWHNEVHSNFYYWSQLTNYAKETISRSFKTFAIKLINNTNNSRRITVQYCST